MNGSRVNEAIGRARRAAVKRPTNLSTGSVRGDGNGNGRVEKSAVRVEFGIGDKAGVTRTVFGSRRRDSKITSGFGQGCLAIEFRNQKKIAVVHVIIESMDGEDIITTNEKTRSVWQDDFLENHGLYSGPRGWRKGVPIQ